MSTLYHINIPTLKELPYTRQTNNLPCNKHLIKLMVLLPPLIKCVCVGIWAYNVLLIVCNNCLFLLTSIDPLTLFK